MPPEAIRPSHSFASVSHLFGILCLSFKSRDRIFFPFSTELNVVFLYRRTSHDRSRALGLWKRSESRADHGIISVRGIAVADRQSPKYATMAGTFIGFVLGAEGRCSSKSEDVATQRPGSPSFVRRPVLPDRVSPARSAWPSGLL